MIGTPVVIGFYTESASFVDERYMKNGVPYASTDDVLATLPEISRAEYLTVNIAGVEYWFYPDIYTLVNKIGTLSLIAGSVTLADLANLPANTVIGNMTGSSGVPQAITIAALKNALGLTGTNSGDQDLSIYVLKVLGSRLITTPEGTVLDNTSGTNTGDETEASILAKLGITAISGTNSGDQDLSGLVVKVDGMGLSSNDYTTDEKNKLASLFPILTMTMPVGSTVANRVAGMMSGTDYPADWTIAASGDNPNDLLITHNLGRRIFGVKIHSVVGTAETELERNEAYSGIVTPDLNTLLIKNLATIPLPIVINMIFS